MLNTLRLNRLKAAAAGLTPGAAMVALALAIAFGIKTDPQAASAFSGSTALASYRDPAAATALGVQALQLKQLKENEQASAQLNSAAQLAE